MNRYEVSSDVSEDNEINNAVLHAAIRDRFNVERQIEDAKRGKAAHDVGALLRYKNNLNSEIAEHEQISADFYAKHSDELHGEALNMAKDERGQITHIEVEQPESLAEVIPLHRAAGSGYAPQGAMAAVAQK